ncbi:peptidoglycan DD-metalloendopeptidase family protein [Gallaecimonas sp. GXIMD4217]|uniref:peptidoglycan DD-metalloendopeptidase family protein n=1 Tax=Gallaecimonas sp. GXIMD4217 TaxID=3131927 RepID=UPI00311B08EA
MLHYYRALPKTHKVLVSSLTGLLVLMLLLPSEEAVATRAHDDGTRLQVGQRYPLSVEMRSLQSAELTEQDHAPDLRWQTLKVKSGDSLAKLFQRAGFSARTLHQLMQDGGQDAKTLTLLKPGEELRFASNGQGELLALSYDKSKTQTLNVVKEGEAFVLKVDEKAVESREYFASGTISSSFWNAGIEAGLSPNIIDGIADVLGYDIDFALELRKGDSFSVLYEKDYIDGDFAGDGAILAVEFVNQGEVFRAVRHSDGNYYTPAGKSMRKAFLRSPVSYKYISSSFNPRRLHPVTGRVRPHNGIDYAARTGTPVKSSGDGRVIRSGYTKLNGNYVFIQHGNNYVTKYLHLHRRKVKTGQRVKQGQLIGTVGATGRVTGPHLHYEFLVNGRHRNPRTVKLPEATPVPKKELAAFKAAASEVFARLDGHKRVLLAMN